MQNNKNVLIGLVLLLIVGFVGYVFYTTDGDTPISIKPFNANTSQPTITYTNSEYGFDFSLPTNWQGYTVVAQTWTGNPLKNKTAQSGPKLLIRHPQWTTTAPYEDLPILVFTIPQWNAYLAEDFAVSAAPILATELGRNNKYVFALPPRWDFDYSLGVKDAQDIIASKPLRAFTVGGAQGKLNINVVCDGALAYMTFPDGKSADKFVAECKEGKHPEVIEKYKADMNLGDGAQI